MAGRQERDTLGETTGGKTGSLKRTMWTAALAGGMFSAALANMPFRRNHQYLWVAVGALLAVYVLTVLMRHAGRRVVLGQRLWVAAASGLLPGIVQYILTPWTYGRYFLPRAEAAAQQMLNPPAHVKAPTANPEQVEQMLRFYQSPIGPWVMGAATLALMVIWAAIVGMLVELVFMAFAPKERAPVEET